MVSNEIIELTERKGWRGLNPIQQKAYDEIVTGKNTLIIAPTGSGKTEAALLPVLDLMLKEQAQPVAVLYITPLKALINDLYERITWWASQLGFTVSRKHGDVSKGERARRTRKIPHIIITTPESLKIDLDWASSFRVNYRNLKWVIVDEVHELVGTKRGVQLAILLERLKALAGRDIQRIALSATIGDPKKVARFIFGSSERPVSIIKPRVSKPIRIKIDYASGEDVFEESAKLVSREIEGKTIVFVNSRFIAERLQDYLNKIGLKDIYVHHSSVSAEIREKAEKMFKEGKIRAVVATKTLELGIDIGEVEKIIQYRSPPQVSSLLQRIGRSGHKMGVESRGAIITLDPVDYLISVATAKLALEGWIEEPPDPSIPLDVVSRELVGMTLEAGEASIDDYYNVLRGTGFLGESLSRGDVEKLVDYLVRNKLLVRRPDGKFKVGPTFYKIWRFKDHDKPWWAKSFAEFFTVIPRNEAFTVYYKRKPIGSIDSSYVYRHLREGDIIRLAGGLWQVKEINEQTRSIQVVKGVGEGEIPLWRGETFTRSPRIAEEAYGILESLAETGSYGKPGTLETDPEGDKDLLNMAREYVETGAPIPSPNTMLVENAGDEYVFQYPMGSRVSETLGSILSFIVSKKHGLGTYYRSSTLGFSVKTPNGINALDLLFSLDPEDIDELAVKAALRTPYYNLVTSEIRASFGIVVKADPEEDQILLEDALKQVINRIFDINGVKEFISKLQSGEIKIYTKTTGPLTPVARHILSLPQVKPWMKRVERLLAENLQGFAMTIPELSEALDLAEKTIENALREMRKPGHPYRVFCFKDPYDNECRWALVGDIEEILEMEEFSESFQPVKDEPFQVEIHTSRGGVPYTFMVSAKEDGVEGKISMIPSEVYSVRVKSMNPYDERDVNYLHAPKELVPHLIRNGMAYIQRTRMYY
ncbi:MAG: DEAD/DEAH box helicase [Desulfurococcales archaeon]|nr:DEAD/DEAH box helicase [Desulfurococcales archaeon]